MTFMSFGRLSCPYLFFGITFFFFAPRSQVSQKSWKSYFSTILASWRRLSVWLLKLKVIFFASKVIFENESHIAKSTSKEKSPNFPYHNVRKGDKGENQIQILEWRVTKANGLADEIGTDSLLLGSITPTYAFEAICTTLVVIAESLNSLNCID